MKKSVLSTFVSAYEIEVAKIIWLRNNQPELVTNSYVCVKMIKDFIVLQGDCHKGNCYQATWKTSTIKSYCGVNPVKCSGPPDDIQP